MRKNYNIRNLIYFIFDNKLSSYVSGKINIKLLDNKKLRKGINIIKLNEEFAIVKSTSINNKSLIKFLRQRKIIINF